MKSTGLITLVGQCPSKSNQYKIGIIGGKKVKARAMMRKSKEMTDWEKSVLEQLKKHQSPMVEEEFHLGVNVFFTTWKSDLDNSFKGLLDCLQKAMWISNDNNCVMIRARKYVSSNPRIEFELRWEG
jgi:Holliday junction resolvase RusA-like endonuclease